MSIAELVKKAKFTVLLGKNGAGKSTLLRSLDGTDGHSVKYVTPERGGTLKYNPSVDNNISNNVDWLRSTRQRNRAEQFREQSAAQFRSLEMLVLREIEQDPKKRGDSDYTFDLILAKINALLPAIKLVRSEKGFSITSKMGQPIEEELLSSGEAELIALAIEVLVFSRSMASNKLLLLDEPDVHLHPDLQQKFVGFVEEISVEHSIRVVIATHSTAIIGAFTTNADLQVVPVSAKDQQDFVEFRRDAVAEQVLPVFGAHPLSTIFNKSRIVLVEGEDDRRVLDQVVRSGNGRYKFSPCVVGSVDIMGKWEKWLNTFLPVLYDEPSGYSMRDLDDSQQTEIDDLGCVCRIRLNCYAMENLLLSKQCLAAHGFANGDGFKAELQKWVDTYPAHQFAGDVRLLIDGFELRRRMKVKDVRNIVVAQLGSNKPWELIVGQLIAANVSALDGDPDSIQTYLGAKAVQKLFC